MADRNESILDSIKNSLGIEEDETAFDDDLTMHINSVFGVLNQLGVGPKAPYFITNASNTWGEFTNLPKGTIEYVKSYMYLKVKLIFDPPGSSIAAESMKQTANEYEWRLMVAMEQLPKNEGEEDE